MPAMIRMAGETEAEFKRRAQPFYRDLGATMMSKELVKIYEARSVLADFVRAGRVRDVANEVCCPEKFDRPGTFTWDISNDAPTAS